MTNNTVSVYGKTTGVALAFAGALIFVRDRLRGIAAVTITPLALGTLMTMFPATAQAVEEYKIDSPEVVLGERELELRATYTGDSSVERDGDQGYWLALGNAFTDYWATELYAIFGRPPGGSLHTTAVEWDNRFKFVPQGKYWMDVGLQTELRIATRSGQPNEFTLIPLLEKQFGHTLVTLNPLFERQFGDHARTGTLFLYRARIEYLASPALSPALELHGEPGVLGRFDDSSSQRHQIGPALYGVRHFHNRRSLRYSAAVLFGMTDGSPDTTVTTRLEYEF